MHARMGSFARLVYGVIAAEDLLERTTIQSFDPRGHCGNAWTVNDRDDMERLLRLGITWNDASSIPPETT